MSGISLVYFALACGALFVLGQRRALFPYLLVFVLGLEYFSPGAADSVFTIPKLGFLSLVLSQIGAGRALRVFTTRGLMFPLVVFAGYLIMTILWSLDPGRALVRGTSLVLLLILFVVVQGFVRTATDLQAFWGAFLLYGFVSAAGTIYEVLGGTTSYVEEAGARAGGLGVNPTEGAYYTSIGMLILMAYFGGGLRVAAWMRRPMVQLSAFGVLCAGVIATGSRGGIVGLVCATLALMLLSDVAARHRAGAVSKYLALGVLMGVVVLALPSVSSMVVARFAESGADQLGNRLNIWGEIWSSIVQHPLIGNGLNSTAIVTGRYDQTFTYSAHNTPLAVLLDGGTLGLLFFLFVGLRIVTIMRRIRRRGPPELQIHGTILSVVVVLSGVTMLSHDLLYFKFLWCLLGLVEGTNYLLRNQVHPRLQQRPGGFRRSVPETS